MRNNELFTAGDVAAASLIIMPSAEEMKDLCSDVSKEFGATFEPSKKKLAQFEQFPPGPEILGTVCKQNQNRVEKYCAATSASDITRLSNSVQ